MGTKRGKKPASRKSGAERKPAAEVMAGLERSKDRMFARYLKEPDAPLDLEAANTPGKTFHCDCALPVLTIGGQAVAHVRVNTPNGKPWKLELVYEGRRYALDTDLAWWYVSSSEGNRRVATDSPLHERLDRKGGVDRQNLPVS